MKPCRLLDAQGNAVEIANELGRGGEGVVFDVAGRPDAVAKVYLKPPNAQHAAKLSAMTRMANASLLKIAAWPTGTLHDPSGAIAGFTMPKVGGHKPIFKLYLPKPRLQEFPTADWRLLIHAAANTARAFATVHSTGFVIGDVNHGNLVVAQDATVRMIDCDSFQVSSGGQTWFCTVGVGTHQPPEMQRRDSYAGIVRTPNHDNFGLAVIVFQLLCMARHPFAGRLVGAGEPPSIEEAIAASRYAYSRDHSRTKMDVPPGSLSIDALTPELQDLFETAFAPGATLGGRPVADRWVSALGGLASDLKPCRSNRAHFYRSGLSACPWCAIEAASGVTLFPVIFVPGTVGSSGMAALWQEVSKVADPPSLGPWPSTPTPNARLSPEARDAATSGRRLRMAAWASVAAAMAAVLAIASPDARALLVPAIGVLTFLIFRHARKTHPGPFRQRLADVEQDWEALRAAWTTPLAGQGLPDIRAGLSQLEAVYDALPTERAKRLQRLHEQRRDKQLEEHLDRFLLANSDIPGIGPTRVATLASHGIDTAGDIVGVRVLAVPGFGPATVTKLLAWRRVHELSFRFDPNRGVSSSDMAVVERDIATHRAKLERDVSAGVGRLKSVSAAMVTRRQALHGRLSELGPRFAQALADAAVVPEGRETHVRLLAMSGLATAVALVSAVGVPPPPGTAKMPVSAPLSPARTASPVSSPLPVSDHPAATHLMPPTGSLQPDPARSDTSPSVGRPATLTPSASKPDTVPASKNHGDRVTLKQTANIRSASNNMASIVRTAPQGSILKLFAKSAGWFQVETTSPGVGCSGV